MKRIYFVRHGESEWNVADRICGATDIPLTDRGRAQAVETGRRIREMGICAEGILYSPLSRAAETAQLIARETGLPAMPEPRLTEQRFGIWEGTSPRRSEGFTLAKQQFVSRFGNGESMLQLAQRVYNLLDELRADDTRKSVILVAHNGIARVVCSYFNEMTNEGFADYHVGNAEVIGFDFL